MSPVDLPGVGPVTLSDIVAALPEEMVGARFAATWGPITGVLVNVKYGHLAKLRRIELNECSHPVPDERGVAGAERIAKIAESAGRDDLVLCLVSTSLLAAASLTNETEATAQQDLAALAEALRLVQFRKVAVPILVHPIERTGLPLLDLSPLPQDGTPLSQSKDYEAALRDVVSGVQRRLLSLGEAAAGTVPA